MRWPWNRIPDTTITETITAQDGDVSEFPDLEAGLTASVHPPEAKPIPYRPVLDDTLPALTAAAVSMDELPDRTRTTPADDTWQREMWDYYESGGEFGFAITWKSNMISQIRLRPGREAPDQDEPALLTEEEHDETAELVKDIIGDLGGGIGGQSEILSALGVHLNVPGEAWLCAVNTPDGGHDWDVYSNEDIRTTGSGKWQVLSDKEKNKMTWVDVTGDFPPIRIFRRSKRRRNQPDSSGRRARSALRELELANRAIQARYLSRLASAGLIVLPQEVEFPVEERFKTASFPFVAQWIEMAKQAIATPGTAAACVPLPIQVPYEYIKDGVKFIDFSTSEDAQLLEKRESAIRRLAAQVDVPAEIMLGLGDVNHWSAWQIEEDAIKAHIKPDVELICAALTRRYLWPQLQAAGVENYREWVVWFDASEITSRPDRSESAIRLYDRFELSGEALRREGGFDEADAPDDDMLKEQILKKLAAEPSAASAALRELTGAEIDVRDHIAATDPNQEQGNPTQGDDTQEDDEDREQRGIPDTRNEPPPPPDDSARRAAQTSRRRRQAAAAHVVSINGGKITYLAHPTLCRDWLQSCPYTHAVENGHHPALPGTSGSYDVTLNGLGRLTVGKLTYRAGDMLLTPVLHPRELIGK